jgi:hypothetical protein
MSWFRLCLRAGNVLINSFRLKSILRYALELSKFQCTTIFWASLPNFCRSKPLEIKLFKKKLVLFVRYGNRSGFSVNRFLYFYINLDIVRRFKNVYFDIILFALKSCLCSHVVTKKMHFWVFCLRIAKILILKIFEQIVRRIFIKT